MEINLTKVPEEFKAEIIKTVKKFFAVKKLNDRLVVNVEFATEQKIKKLNKKYRQIDKPTDVLSFPIWENLQSLPKNGEINLGDIIICPSQSKESISNLVEHSLNHLIGIHH